MLSWENAATSLLFESISNATVDPITTVIINTLSTVGQGGAFRQTKDKVNLNQISQTNVFFSYIVKNVCDEILLKL